MLARMQAAGLEGISGYPVEVQTYARNSTPRFSVVGLPDAALREARDRVKAAILSSDYTFPAMEFTTNLTPARRRKDEGAAFDLPIALSILAAIEPAEIPPARLERVAALGELTLAGETRPVRGALAAAETLAACDPPPEMLLVPAANAEAAAFGCGGRVPVVEVDTLSQAVAILTGKAPATPVEVNVERILAAPAACDALDLRDVRGNDAAKQALEVAAAGAHDLLFIGPPGAGKTMLARRLPGLLPQLRLDEVLEVSRVHAIASGVDPEHANSLVRRRPFRAPHHTASYASLVGGGSSPRPGEISLAHKGVLFLDELPEFSGRSLEALREPLEERKITVARSRGSMTFPAEFQLVAAMNPCPCGYLGVQSVGRALRCKCAAQTAERYQQRISGPLLDRIDLVARLQPVPPALLQAPPSRDESATSAAVARRVREARAIQLERAGLLNARLDARALTRTLGLTPAAKSVLLRAGERNLLTGRGLAKVQRVARTLADLDGRTKVDREHVARAVHLRAGERRAA